jgi:predicted DNA-binding protein
LYCYDFELETPERIARTRPINSTKSSDGLVETEDQEMTVQMTMGVDATMESMLTSLRAGTKIFVRLDAIGATISTTYKYMVRHDMCILLNEVGDFQSSDNVLVVPISGVLARDTTSGYALQVTARNTLAAL